MTLNVYSGNQNPEWTLQRTDNGFSAVLNKVFNLKTQSQLANTGGYQGFNVELFKGTLYVSYKYFVKYNSSLCATQRHQVYLF